ncbi:hypothetical protein ACOSQ3_012273 [Xanthoceras sorbifolium]
MDFDEIERRCVKLSLIDEDSPVGVVEDSLQDRGMRELALCLIGLRLDEMSGVIREIDTRSNGECSRRSISV